MVDPTAERVNINWGNFFREKDGVKSGTGNFLFGNLSVYHRGESVYQDITYINIMSVYDPDIKTEK